MSKPPPNRLFVLTVPGLGSLVSREISALSGFRVTGKGNDGRADVVLCEAEPGRELALLELGSAEDVFVEIGRTLRAEGDRAAWIAKRLWKPTRAARAVNRWRATSKVRGAPTYRVVARVLQERSFRRTELRRAIEAVVAKAEPRWRPADPAGLELWIVEYERGKFVAGVRLSSAEMRQHGGRPAERSGALRPAVAAAMVALAGTPPGRLLDPCCGSGTILAEAQAVGWDVSGVDVDPSAVRTARRNVDRADLEIGDARKLRFDDGSVDAIVSNLPFGRQFAVAGDADEWLRTVLREMSRVVRPGGIVVLLSPTLPRAVIPPTMRVSERFSLRLLGVQTVLWRLDLRLDLRQVRHE